MAQLYAEVIVDSAGNKLPSALTYVVPEELKHKVQRGSVVVVPLRKSLEVGYILSLTFKTDLPPERLRKLYRVVEEAPLVSPELFELAEWMAHEYFCTYAQALRQVLPAGSRQRVEKQLVLVKETGLQAALARSRGRTKAAAEKLVELLQAGAATEYQAMRAAGRRDYKLGLNWLVKHEFVEVRYLLKAATAKAKEEVQYQLAPEPDKPPKLTAKQAQVLAVVAEVGSATAAEIARLAGVSTSVVKSCLAKGLLKKRTERKWRAPDKASTTDEAKQQPLTESQKQAFEVIEEALERGQGTTVLLEGITGSGKTRVYLEAVKKVLDQGKSALILLPEISLTAQVIALATHWFGDLVAVWHSALSAGERFDEWHRVRRGKARVVIGARSAVFAPVQRLGLIVVDEEFESSYKQESPPRYNAVEVAEWRAKRVDCAVVLVSATPSLESEYKARSGVYLHAKLPERIGKARLPEIEVVDLCEIPAKELHERCMVSPRLEKALEETFARGEQALVFLNRRGYSPVMLCDDCGKSVKCPNCEVALTYHQRDRELRCHYCGYTTPPPETCEHCGGYTWRLSGTGTERVEEFLKERFPEVRVARMDRDTITKKSAYVKLYSQVRAGEIDLLLGTQMVTKGFDFPGVTLVGVLLAEQGLLFSDFRASERTFQLLVQVSGRAGRAEKPGKVVLQTYDRDHYAITTAIAQDYEGFFAKELEFRRKAGYPPFRELYRILCRHQDEATASKQLWQIADALEKGLGERVELLAPAPCPFEKLQGYYRWHLLLKSKSRQEIHEELWRILRELGPQVMKGCYVDVGPRSLV